MKLSANATQVVHRFVVVFFHMARDFEDDPKREQRDWLGTRRGLRTGFKDARSCITYAITQNLQLSVWSVESQLLQPFRSASVFGNGQHVAWVCGGDETNYSRPGERWG